MAFQWDNSLSVGVDIVDAQHKGIFTRVDNLLNSMSKGKGRDEIGKVVVFLADYVVKHFKEEESLMLKHDYNGYAKQKEEHVQFIKDFTNIKKEFDTNGVSTLLVVQVQNKVCNWLKIHIGNEDKKIGEFLKAKGSPLPVAV